MLALVNLTLELERITDGLVAGRQGKLIRKSGVAGPYGHWTLMYRQGDAHLVIHISGQIQTLLKSLGLDKQIEAMQSRVVRRNKDVNNVSALEVLLVACGTSHM